VNDLDFDVRNEASVYYTRDPLGGWLSSSVIEVGWSGSTRVYFIENPAQTPRKLNNDTVPPSNIKAKFKRRKPL